MDSVSSSRRSVLGVQIARHGGRDELDLVELEAPEPVAGEVLIRTVASSINPVDWKTREWDRGPSLPMVLGWDLAGIVTQSRAARFAPGDRVVAMSGQASTGRGTWCETVALPAGLLAHAPRTVSLREAATLPLAGLTARQSLAALALPPGSRLLVVGAVGAVGALAAQLAVAAGIVVDGVVSRAENVPAAQAIGVQTVVTDMAALPPSSYDAVLDTAGVAPGAVLRDGAVYLSISDEPLPPIPTARGIGVQEDGAGLGELVRLVDHGVLRLRIAAQFPLREIRAAHEVFEAGGLAGKVVLDF